MPDDIESWMSEVAADSLARIGIARGQTVMDFGCGPGYTSIPAAKVVGETGRVYAVEKSRRDVRRLGRLMKDSDIDNITVINTHGELDLPLDNDVMDFILAFDVLLPYYFSDAGLAYVIREMYRVSKPGCILAVYPSHVSIEDIRPSISAGGFEPSQQLFLPVLHNGKLERGEIFAFTASVALFR